MLAFFLLAIWLPLLEWNQGLFREHAYQENRELAEKPEFNLYGLRRYPDSFQSYFADHFGFRNHLIRWNNILKFKCLGVSPVSSVVVGKDSWLFYRSEVLEDGNTFDDHRGALKLSSQELSSLQKIIEENHRRFAAHGSAYVVVVVPNKNTLHEDVLPETVSGCDQRRRLDHLVDKLRRDSKVRVVDLRESLAAARREFPVYLKTDSHWNMHGAYIGYREIMKELSLVLGHMPALPIDGEGVSVERSFPGGDLAQMLFMDDLLPEDNHARFNLDMRGASPKLGRLIFRHDSFGDNLYPFLSHHFEKIKGLPPFVPYRYETIEAERPDVVLHVFAERYLTMALHDDFQYDRLNGIPR